MSGFRFFCPFKMQNDRFGSTCHLVPFRCEPSQCIYTDPNASNFCAEYRVAGAQMRQIELRDHLSSLDRKNADDPIDSDADESLANIIRSTVRAGFQDLHANVQIRLLPKFDHFFACPPIPAHEGFIRTSGNKMLA